jgi:hypothetical protein
MTVKYWHKRVRGSEKWLDVERLRFEIRDKKVLLAGHTATNCDVEVEIDADTLMALMREYVQRKVASHEGADHSPALGLADSAGGQEHRDP